MTMIEVGDVPIVEATPSLEGSASPKRNKLSTTRTSSPRLSKKQQQKLLEASSSQNNGGNRKMVFGMLVALYLVCVLAFCAHQFLVDPSQMNRMLTAMASNAQTHKVNSQLPPGLQPQSIVVQNTNGQQQQRHGGGGGGCVQCDTCSKCQQQQSGTSIQQQPGGVKTRVVFEQGHVLNGEVHFYRCDIAGESRRDMRTTSALLGQSRDIVILDGKRFFDREALPKEGSVNMKDPKYSGGDTILQLCGKATQSGLLDSVTVLEMDGENQEPKKLMQALEVLLEADKVLALPVAALVTPGQSSSLVLDWILYEDFQALQTRVAQHWIPVSAGSAVMQTLGMDGFDDLNSKRDSDVELLRLTHPLRVIDEWPVMAVYCTRDSTSMHAGRLLQRAALAELSMIEGDAECFTDDPSAASDALLVYMREHLPQVDWSSGVWGPAQGTLWT